MDLRHIEVTWMDGQQVTYQNVTASVLNGVLHIHQYTSITHSLQNEWHFPISNIRVWGPVPNGHDVKG